MNRPVRIRMQGRVVRAGEKPALTRLALAYTTISKTEMSQSL